MGLRSWMWAQSEERSRVLLDTSALRKRPGATSHSVQPSRRSCTEQHEGLETVCHCISYVPLAVFTVPCIANSCFPQPYLLHCLQVDSFDWTEGVHLPFLTPSFQNPHSGLYDNIVHLILHARVGVTLQLGRVVQILHAFFQLGSTAWQLAMPPCGIPRVSRGISLYTRRFINQH